MLRTLSGIVFVAFLALPAPGQDIVPRYELFGGYSFLDADDGKPRKALNGWGSDFTVNLIGPLGATASFSRQYGTRGFFPCSRVVFPSGPQVVCPEPRNVRLQQVLFGPRYNFRTKRMTAFVHGLFGFSNADQGSSDWRPRSFAMGGGFGLDLPLSDRLSFRAFQADYLPVRRDAISWWQDVRFQMGIVVKFGRR